MRFRVLVIVTLLLFPFASFSQQASRGTKLSGPPPGTPAPQPPIRDPQALALLQSSARALGGNVPSDSAATGTVEAVVGPRQEQGTIRILTRGTSQTYEELNLPSGTRAQVYSHGAASVNAGSTPQKLEGQFAISGQAVDFPLPFISGALSNTNQSFRYVGAETLDGVSVEHVRTWDSFGSKPNGQRLSALTVKDIWINAATNMPVSISYDRHAAGTFGATIHVAVDFANYRDVQGFLYPFEITQSVNGVPFATITIENVSFNTGLTDANFPIQ